MRKTILMFALLFIVCDGFSQSRSSQDVSRTISYTPRKLSAGTAMTALTMNTSLDDTTNVIDTRGFTYTGIQIVPSSDSIGVLVSWQVSRDKSTWSTFTVEDSLINRTSAVTELKGIALPDDAMAFPFVRARFTDSEDAGFGQNPAPTLSIRVVQRY